MIKREIKAFSVALPDGYIYEGQAPIGLLPAMIERGLCTESDAEEGKAVLPEECVFRSETELSEFDIEKRHIYIELSGIYAIAEIFFNGKSCGISASPFRRYLLDVRDKAVLGKNVVEIRCSEPISPKAHLNCYGDRSTEYDTAKRVADFEILNPIGIYVSDTAFISDVSVRQEHTGGKVSLFVSADTVGEKDDVRVVASLSAPSGKIYFGGAYEDNIKIVVSDPELWWPRGYGAQPIYKLTVTLYHGAEVADVYEKKIGLRTVELANGENSVPAVYVNGVKIFSRGGAYVKQKAVSPSVKNAEIESILRLAVGANMNTITVFDENVPLSDFFYNTCDKLGILLWHSLTLPYIAPPAASVFASGVTDAVRDNVKRLASHPSTALIFLDFAETNEKMMRLFKEAIDEFRAVSLRILDPVLKDSAPDVPFIADAYDLFKHDERYLFVKDARFADAMLYALPSECVLKSYLDTGSYNLFSYASESRTNVSECLKMLEHTVSYMKLPSGMSELVYASELATGCEVSRSIKLARTFDKCESAVLRQLNDGRKTVSSSMIDGFGKPKAALKLIAEAYSPVMIDIIPCVNETVFQVTNSTKKDYHGKLVYSLYDTQGTCYVEKRIDIELESGKSVIVETADFSRFVGEKSDSCYIVYELYSEKGIIASGSEHFVPLKHFVFRDPEIAWEISGIGKKFSVKLNSSWYAPAVKVDFEDINVNFNTNFVNLYGKTPVAIDFETSEVVTLGELEKKIRIYTPHGIGR